MYAAINIPQLSQKEVFSVVPTEHGFDVFNTTTESVVYSISAANTKGQADQIRMLLNDVLKSGFEQGRRHVREALGVK